MQNDKSICDLQRFQRFQIIVAVVAAREKV